MVNNVFELKTCNILHLDIWRLLRSEYIYIYKYKSIISDKKINSFSTISRDDTRLNKHLYCRKIVFEESALLTVVG